jgi:hypothetical protein
MFDTVDVKELYLLQVDWATTAFNDLELGNEPLVRNTWGMVREEATELLEAKDDVEILDAMCDLFVVFSQIIHLYRKKLQSLDLNEVGKIPGFNHKKFANKVLYLIDRQQELLNAQTLPVYWSLVADTLESEKDLPILEGIREVTSSNWSKFPTVQTLKEKHNVESEEEAISEECSWIVANRKHTGILPTSFKSRD